VNAPNWIKRNNGDKPKRKRDKYKAHVSKDDSGSETAASTLNPTKPRHMDKLLSLLSDCLEDGQMSNVVQDPTNEKVSIVWNKNTTHRLIAIEMAAISSINTPFCFNTGATSHISPFKLDFIRINPIEPKGIRGVNGTSIPAIGIGVIKIRCGKGRRLTLNYALYALQAA